MLNAISVDVEEYFHATNLEPVAPPSRWHTLPSRVEDTTRKVLDLFAECNTRGTFFILGTVARRHPRLVREIAQHGHEIASHGYAHQIAYRQTPRAFYRDVYRSRRLLEEISGKEVIGYRAPSFSITRANPWAYDALVRAGYRYDSSIYPTWHPRYSNLGKPRLPYRVHAAGKSIVEIPLAVTEHRVFGWRVRFPVGGGAYWRLLPLGFITRGLRSINHFENRSFCSYFHPWDLDAEQPLADEVDLLTRLRHYGGCSSFSHRLKALLLTFHFAPVAEVWQSLLENREGSGS